MRRRRKLYFLLLIILLTLCFMSVLYMAISIEVSYFLGVQIHSLSFERFVQETNSCEVLHVAIVIGGFTTSSRTSVLLKSLFHFHPSPLHLHLIVDDAGNEVMPTLIDTWQLANVEYTMYNVSDYENRVSWIPNRHYSHNFGLIKLILPDIIDRTVEKVLLLDADVLIVNDVRKLLVHWDRMNDSQIYAMVENLSNWYTTQDPINHVWPAIENGFNSGVALVNLARMRELHWNNIWRSVAQEHLREYGRTMLADQDILNAVFKLFPQFIYKLPCEFNLQLGFSSQPDLCKVSLKDVSIVHWNSPLKTSTNNRYASFFKRYYTTFSDMDGYFLQQTREDCGSPTEISGTFVYEYDDNADGCAEIFHARDTLFRTHKFVKPFQLEDSLNDITLVTQLSIDRLPMLEKVLTAWEGPASIAIYLTDTEFSQLIAYVSEQTEVFRPNVALHAVFKKGYLYPVNYLRNVALNSSRTDFVYLADVDFLPSTGIYSFLRHHVTSLNTVRTSLVVPAFEYLGTKRVEKSLSKTELLEQIQQNQVQFFREDVWPRGHAPTDYEKWKVAMEHYQVGWQPNYEPYVVVRKNETPPYDMRFLGFGWNKVTHIMRMNSMNFSFVVLPDVFSVHHPHSSSFDAVRFRNSQVYRKCMKSLKGEFVRDLLNHH